MRTCTQYGYYSYVVAMHVDDIDDGNMLCAHIVYQLSDMQHLQILVMDLRERCVDEGLCQEAVHSCTRTPHSHQRRST